ncbi:unnamed protein product [Calypogeia fissa]
MQEEAAEHEREPTRALYDTLQLNESCEEEKKRLEKLEFDLNLMREEEDEKKRKLVEAHTNELDKFLATEEKASLGGDIPKKKGTQNPNATRLHPVYQIETLYLTWPYVGAHHQNPPSKQGNVRAQEGGGQKFKEMEQNHEKK